MFKKPSAAAVLPIPITEAQVQAIIDSFFTWFLSVQTSVLAKLVVSAIQQGIDSEGLPLFWAWLQAQGIVTRPLAK